MNTHHESPTAVPTVAAGLDPRQLEVALAALRSHYGADLAVSGDPRQLTGGFWAEMWALELTHQAHGLPDRVVLRLAPNAEHSAKETAIQRGVAAAGFPTPSIFASGAGTPATSGDAAATAASSSGLRSWNVMGFAQGQPLLAGLSGISALVKLPQLARALPDQLAQVMAQLHALDVATLDIRVQKHGEPTADSTNADQDPNSDSVGGILQHFRLRSDAIGDTTLIHAVRWLEANRPSNQQVVMCHGDLHPFNVLQHKGQLIVLDWTAAQIADPAYDVAYTALLLASAPLQAPRAIMPLINWAARALSRRFVRCYQRHSATPSIALQRFDWYTTLHHVRILLEIAEWRQAGVLEDHKGHPHLTMHAAVEAAVATQTGATFS